MRLALLLLVGLAAPAAFAQAGTPDPAFGTDGVVRFAPGPDHQATDIVALPDGRALVAGAEAGDAVVYRLDAGGALDPSFGDAGVVRLDYGGRESAAALVITADGRIVVAVDRPGADEYEKAAMVALAPNGALDGSFGRDGLAVVGGATWRDLALDPDGRLVGLLATPSSISIALRFSPDGVFDASYGGTGVATFFDTAPTPGTPQSYLDELALDDQGRAVAVGVVRGIDINDPFEPVVVRLTEDGEADLTFGDGGDVRPALDGSYPILLAVALDDAGRILAAGAEGLDVGAGVVLRLTPDGALDPTFGDGGVVRVVPDVPLTQLPALTVQPDGKILAAGEAGTRSSAGFVAARLLPDGRLDPAFGTGGITRLAASDDTETALAVALASDGDVVLAGVRRIGSWFDRAVVARLLNDVVVAGEPGATNGGLALTSAGSNPSRRPRVRLSLDEAAAVHIAVVDTRGRTVAVLHDGPLAAGPAEFGLGALAPGVYLVRAASASGRAALPVAVVR